MANLILPYGFRHSGFQTGHPANFGNSLVKIAQAYSTPINFGDPVVRLSSGYIAKAAAGATQIHGIFIGCQYLSAALGYTRYGNFYPGGSDALADVSAWVISTQDAVFQVQTGNSSTTPVAATNAAVGMNIGFNYGTAPAAVGVSRISSGYADLSTLGTTTSLPCKVLALVSDPPGVNGTDLTTGGNDIYVTFNNTDYHAPTAGI